MAVHPIYRESWTKHNGWKVRIDFIAAGGDATEYSNRTVYPMTNVFESVSGHNCSFEKIPYGASDAQDCTFVINYNNAPPEVQDAIIAQSATLDAQTGYEGTALPYIDVSGFEQPNLFVIQSDRGTFAASGTSTWYIEFAGCQRVTPEQEVRPEVNGMKIEIQAIGLHKLALEAVDDLTTYITVYLFYANLVSGGVPGADGDGSAVPVYPIRYGGYNYRFLDPYSRQHFSQIPSQPYYHWVAPLWSVFEYLSNAMARALGLLTQQPCNVTLSNIKDAPNLIPIKFYGQKTLEANLVCLERGAEISKTSSTENGLWFIFSITQGGYSTSGGYTYNEGLLRHWTQRNNWVGGLFTAKGEQTVQKDAKNAWDLLKLLAENFFLKVTPFYQVASNALQSHFKFVPPLGSSWGGTAINYADGAGDDKKFFLNADRVTKLKVLLDSVKKEALNFEIYTKGKSDGNGFEMKSIFHCDITMPNSGFDVKNFDLRRLYYIDNETGQEADNILIGVNPHIDTRWRGSGVWQEDAPGAFGTPLFPQFPYEKAFSSSGVLEVTNWAANVQATPTGAKFVGYEVFHAFSGAAGCQARYERKLSLSDYILPERVGHELVIEPPSEFDPILSNKAYIISSTVSWQATNPEDDLVEVVALTTSFPIIP